MGMSAVQCMGCMDAVTPSSRNRGTSERFMYWACSTRWRRPKTRAID